MSKMPAKKKSCFQITSVTQAQVAASSIADDTESLDDPDESRTEDASSEIFDVSRAETGVCDRSSSEETLNNVGEPQEGQPPTTATAQSFVPSSATHPMTVISTVPATTVSTSAAHAAPVSTSCSSRFRVIKLDHGTGEPFRRGRWTCTEFYERDSDSNVNRTVDSIKPVVTLEHSIDRDSGLGVTINSVVTSSGFSAQALENTADSSYSIGHPAHPHPSEPLQQGYSFAPQIGSGASPHVMPPATQPQPFAYSSHSTGLSAGQLDYRQQHFGSSSQTLPMTSLPVGPPTSQMPSPLISSAGPGAQGLGGEAASQPVSQTQPSGGLGSAPAPSISITTTTSHSGVQNVPATVPSTINTLPGVPSQAPGTGGLVQPQGAHGGATTGLPSSFSNQAEDSRQKSDALPQPSVGVVPGKDGVKPFIGESLFDISITMDVDEDSASGASVVAIDNKIEQAMDLVKSHLMYAVREEVEVLKEQIKELYERNSMLERENAVLKSLANTEQLSQLSNQLSQLSSQLSQGSSTSPPLHQQHPVVTNNTPTLGQPEGSQSIPHQPNISSA
uniref:TSC22 domain family member 2 n=1 Tax=Mastacembelus armatus TaxID=205130 RepID=A0A7N8X2M3_9TELE